MLEAFVCRIFRHKWQRIRSIEEEGYECRRCGEVYYGPLRSSGGTAHIPSGSGVDSSLGGGGGGGDGGGG